LIESGHYFFNKLFCKSRLDFLYHCKCEVMSISKGKKSLKKSHFFLKRAPSLGCITVLNNLG
jgi:hypothetical protein